MGTDIPLHIMAEIDAVRRAFPGSTLYATGGCLQDRDSQDFDILVQSPHDSANALRHMTALYKQGLFSRIVVTHAYDDEINNPFHTIAVTTIWGEKVDFLFIKQDKSIQDVLNSYPLSIQMRAVSIDTGTEIIGKLYSEHPIIVHRGGKSEAKYREYYPDRLFVNPNLTVREVFDEPPF